MLQIIAQVLTGLRDESKKDWALSELFSQGILSQWTASLGEQGPFCFFFYRNPTPIFQQIIWHDQYLSE